MNASFLRYASIFLVCTSGVVLIALQIKPAGWIVLAMAAASLLFCESKFRRDVFLVVISLAILGLTPINTDISVFHMLVMSSTLAGAVAVPYLLSRFIYRDHAVRFPWRLNRHWSIFDVGYVFLAGALAYAVLPYYLTSTGSYLNWPSAAHGDAVIRLFIGTNALGIWDELFFVNTVLGILRRHFPFGAANIFQAILFTSFLYELGFTSWAFVPIFLFALLQGYMFRKTQSLLYIVAIHLTVDAVLFLAIIHAHHPDMFRIFLM